MISSVRISGGSTIFAQVICSLTTVKPVGAFYKHVATYPMKYNTWNDKLMHKLVVKRIPSSAEV
jgi:hypothetical protein